jgi:hypothetical protein
MATNGTRKTLEAKCHRSAAGMLQFCDKPRIYAQCVRIIRRISADNNRREGELFRKGYDETVESRRQPAREKPTLRAKVWWRYPVLPARFPDRVHRPIAGQKRIGASCLAPTNQFGNETEQNPLAPPLNTSRRPKNMFSWKVLFRFPLSLNLASHCLCNCRANNSPRGTKINQAFGVVFIFIARARFFLTKTPCTGNTQPCLCLSQINGFDFSFA